MLDQNKTKNYTNVSDKLLSWSPAETQDDLTHTWEQHLLHQFSVSTCLSSLNYCAKHQQPVQGSVL